jgi:hypothetical protein
MALPDKPTQLDLERPYGPSRTLVLLTIPNLSDARYNLKQNPNLIAELR